MPLSVTQRFDFSKSHFFSMQFYATAFVQQLFFIPCISRKSTYRRKILSNAFEMRLYSTSSPFMRSKHMTLKVIDHDWVWKCKCRCGKRFRLDNIMCVSLPHTISTQTMLLYFCALLKNKLISCHPPGIFFYLFLKTFWYPCWYWT